jgi:hypothetical protein
MSLRAEVLIVPAAALLAFSGCARGVSRAAEVPAAQEDAAFAALQARGQQGMGVDQYASAHLFDALEDGGRIELQMNADDPAAVARIREHLQEIARAFQAGDFSTPAFVHMQPVPGSAVMAAKRAVITYAYRELPRGGEVRITTRDPDAVVAVHQFMAFQRQDHHAGGAEHPDHSAVLGGMAGMSHEAMHPQATPMHQPGAMPMQGAMSMHGDSAFAADMQLVHELLGGHAQIERTVSNLPNGVRAVTESQNPRLAAYIKEHVASMMERLAKGDVFNVASSTIPVIFQNAERIRTEIEQTEKGVVFTQTTDVPELVPVLQAHALEVSELVQEGMAAMMRSVMQRAGAMSPGGSRH